MPVKAVLARAMPAQAMHADAMIARAMLTRAMPAKAMLARAMPYRRRGFSCPKSSGYPIVCSIQYHAMRPDIERFIMCMEHADRFIQTRIRNGRDVGELMEAQVASLINQAKGLICDAECASAVTEAIEKAHWPTAEKHRLTDAAVTNALGSGPILTKGLRRDTQKCYWFAR